MRSASVLFTKKQKRRIGYSNIPISDGEGLPIAKLPIDFSINSDDEDHDTSHNLLERQRQHVDDFSCFDENSSLFIITLVE